MHAYEETLKATSRKNAPWYAIPADNKLFMRVEVAQTILKTLQAMNPQFPTVENEELAKFDALRTLLMEENK